jgi:hypothetical protein
METTTTSAKLFLTDYASYNNGTQFEFGHWVNLTDFLDAEEFMNYIKNHFAEADKKSPLDSPREEIMFTDYEGLPKELYSESMSADEMERLFEYISLESYAQAIVAYLLSEGYDIDYSLGHYEDVIIYEYSDDLKYHLFEEFYPDAEKAEQSCPYLEINYDAFINDNFTEFEHDGIDYLVYNNY